MSTSDPIDIAIIGAGAAGLFASIWAGREARDGNPTHQTSIVALDGATRLGAKILVAGGGRCNVTHYEVDESAYAGSSPHAIKKVLRQFDVSRTVAFFEELGVILKREETGKLFPTTDSAKTVLAALLRATSDAGVRLVHPWRVASVERDGSRFVIRRETQEATNSDGDQTIVARRLILATGGKSLPKTGSDGTGLEIARSLGHTISDQVFPALVPLTMNKDHWMCALSGLTVDATIELRSATGKRLKQFTNSTLLTHFGLSGPGVLDMSRYLTDERGKDAGAHCVMNWLPGMSLEDADQELERWTRTGKQTPVRWLIQHGLPERLARTICDAASIDSVAHAMTREQRRALATLATATRLPITGDRGWLFAEVTAGGVPLSEVHLGTMESRVCPGLFLCGEILNVDGRIGGFNFQWAWASGYVAGKASAEQLGTESQERC